MALWPFWQSLAFLKKKPEEIVLERLRGVPVFDQVSDRNLKYIQSMCHLREYAENEYVFRAGDPGVGLFIILEGAVDITMQVGEKQETYASVKEGDFFGELALLVDMPRTASAVATQPTNVICFSRIDMLSVISRKPRVGNALLLNMARLVGLRLVMSNKELEKVRKSTGASGSTIEMMDPD
ncbi:MAG: cyclic nucleotide-binding domain-containing protein [Spirochaetia bacterium]|nr:cyclic nucleotide-binding domain-containing protein [Spirochaetia bacterium]